MWNYRDTKKIDTSINPHAFFVVFDRSVRRFRFVNARNLSGVFVWTVWSGLGTRGLGAAVDRHASCVYNMLFSVFTG